ncbi:MAG: winged helix-turn-helix transcriptional regulator [Phycisphaerae bacterium]|nr:winged helix-turn-helix transcriptional regulator [Phycisphaerae bacterium]
MIPDAKMVGLLRRMEVLYPNDVMPLQTWLQLVRVYSRIQRKLEHALAQQEMTLAQFEIMMTLKSCQGISQQELAQHLLVTKGNVCVLVERMEKCGWVERQLDPEDGRAYRLALTATGRTLLKKVLPDQRQIIQEAFGVLTVEESRQLLALLDRLERMLIKT